MDDFTKIRELDNQKDRLFAKETLNKQVKTSVMTAAIFCLQQVEDVFGDLWGETVEDEKLLTDEQRKFDEKWEMVRNRILDNMNKQIRIAHNNINTRYDIAFKRKD